MNARLLKKILFFIVVLPGVPFVLGSMGLLIYSFWPTANLESVEIPLKPEAEHIMLLVHGLKDSPDTWANELARIFQGQMHDEANTVIIPLDWSDYALSMFRCSVNADRIGKRLAVQFSQLEHLQSVHLIAHSCGGFVIHALCQKLKALNSSIQIQSSYLDPVSVYGGLRWDYGVDYFGRCADFSEGYIDREDGIPGSDQPLVNAYTFDVTAARKTIDFDMSPHLWPPFYYIRLSQSDRLLQLRKDPSLLSRYHKGISELVVAVP